MSANVKKLVFTALCCALCLVLPIAFHSIPNGGNILLPMHIPVLLCGWVCGWPFGLACGILGPLLSAVITGMPPAPVLPGMLVECAVYGCAMGLGSGFLKTGKLTRDLYISLGAAMVLGRALSGFAKAWILTPGISPFAWVTTSLVTGIPGICLQLVLLPLAVGALTRSRLIPARYTKE